LCQRRNGTLPTEDDLQRKVMCVSTSITVFHYCWKDRLIIVLIFPILLCNRLNCRHCYNSDFLHTILKSLIIQCLTEKPSLTQETDLLGVSGKTASGSTVTTLNNTALTDSLLHQNPMCACSLEEHGSKRRVMVTPPALPCQFSPVT